MSYIVRLVQGGTTLDLVGVNATPLTEKSVLAEHPIIGTEDGVLQFIGSPPKGLRIEGFVKGDNAREDMQTLENMRANGSTITVTVKGHGGASWEEDTYLIESIEHDLEAGKPNPAGAAKARYSITLVKV